MGGWGEKPYSSKPAGTEEKLFKKSIDCQQKIEVIEGKFKFSWYYRNLILQVGTCKGMWIRTLRQRVSLGLLWYQSLWGQYWNFLSSDSVILSHFLKQSSSLHLHQEESSHLGPRAREVPECLWGPSRRSQEWAGSTLPVLCYQSSK